jgi:uncharacterized cupredoxin-like copper-binding protein
MRNACALPMIALLLMASPSRSLAATPYESMSDVVQERMANFWFGHRDEASHATRTIQVVMHGSRFIPANITVQRGETVHFLVINRDSIAHEFVLGDAAEQAAHEQEMASMRGMPMNDSNGVTVAPGSTSSLVWTFTRAGHLQYACHLPGHYDAGMVGYLTIRE